MITSLLRTENVARNEKIIKAKAVSEKRTLACLLSTKSFGECTNIFSRMKLRSVSAAELEGKSKVKTLIMRLACTSFLMSQRYPAIDNFSACTENTHECIDRIFLFQLLTWVPVLIKMDITFQITNTYALSMFSEF